MKSKNRLFSQGIRRLLLAWLSAVLIEIVLLPTALRNPAGLDGLAQMSLLRVLCVTTGIMLLLCCLSRFFQTEKAERCGIAVVFSALALLVLLSPYVFSVGMAVACVACLLILGFFCLRGWNSEPEAGGCPESAGENSGKCWVWITAILTGMLFLLLCAWTVGRVYSFCAPAYDFGIFSQMFYYLKETGLPWTTLERDGLLSHFSVHVSPIYYLLLPFYCLIPVPAFLQVLQAAVMASAVIPLWKIGKQRGLCRMERMFLCALLLLYPAYAGGVAYDLHENCFLTPLILWLFYGIERRKTGWIMIFAFLTLMVKEDAAVYVAVIALWMLVRGLLRPEQTPLREHLTALALLVVSCGWFLLVTGYLAQHGDGVMTYRYANFLYGESSSLLTVIKAVILHPMKVLYECTEAEKLSFLALTLLPVLGLPLLTRRYERYILLIPYMLINLMSDYLYQHNIFFQYTFGSCAFLLYLTVINLSDWKRGRKQTMAATCVVSAALFVTSIFPLATVYPQKAIRNFSTYQGIRETLDVIPEEASVTAATFYTVHLSQREILYDLKYCSWEHLLASDYVVLQLSAKNDFRNYATHAQDDGYENLIFQLEANGYRLETTYENVLAIYKKEK